MRKRKQKAMFRKALRFRSRGSQYEQKLNPAFEKNLVEWKKLETGMRSVQFAFRSGFSDRVTARVAALMDKDPMREFYASLSSLFPKIAYSSLFVLVLIVVTIFLIHGELDHNLLMGADRIDDSNFISYLIFQGN